MHLKTLSFAALLAQCANAQETQNLRRDLVQGAGQVRCTNPEGCLEIQFGNVHIEKLWVDHPNIHWRCAKPGLVALTFDDGPQSATPDIVNTLDELEVPGTFFVNAQRVEEVPLSGKLLTEMEKRGHMIAHHTYHHLSFTGTEMEEKGSVQFFKEEIKAAEDLINPFLKGGMRKFVRPPWLDINEDVATLLGYEGIKVVQISIDTKDYEEDEVLDDMIKAFSYRVEGPGEETVRSEANSHISLQHDVSRTIPVIAPAVAALKEGGFEFVTIEKCLDPAAPEPDTTEEGPFSALSWGCIGEPCDNPNHCRSKYNSCGDTSDFCNAESIWSSECGDAISKTCTGEPCRQSTMCRSKWGNCGKGEEYCNEESLWTSDCAGPPEEEDKGTSAGVQAGISVASAIVMTCAVIFQVL